MEAGDPEPKRMQDKYLVSRLEEFKITKPDIRASIAYLKQLNQQHKVCLGKR